MSGQNTVQQSAIQLGTSLVPYQLVLSAKRRKTIALKIEPQGELVITAPTRTKLAEVERVIFERAQWILRGLREATARQAKREALPEGVHYLGQHYPLNVTEQPGRSPAPVLQDGALHVIIPPEPNPTQRAALIAARINSWHRAQARTVLKARLDHWAGQFGLSYGQFILSSPARRWGSCDGRNNIRLNWRLILTPLEQIDYVAAHELAHVLHKDHSPRFWAALARIMPDYAARQRKLTEYGRDLMI